MQETTVVVGEIETLDPAVGRTNAMLIEGGVVIAHGEDALTHTADRRVESDGTVVPGLVDAHNHFALAGQVDLFEFEQPPTASLDELLAALRDHAATRPADAWIVGGSWGSGLLGELSTLQTLARLDDAVGGRPAMLRDDSKHNRWASSEALRRAGITSTSADPPGGEVLRTDGRPNGVLLEAAGIAVEHALEHDEPASAERLAASAERAIEMLHAHGITAFQDAASSLQLLHALKALDDAGRLRAWVVTSMLANDFIFGSAPLGEGIIVDREVTASRHHRPDFIKIFLDGVPPSRTGAFLEPYLPDACGHVTSGEPTMSADELLGWMRSAAERGIGAKVHCTGDRSVRMVLDAAEELVASGLRAPWHVAHGQFVADDDIPRFAELGVVAEISPALWFPGVIPDAIATVLPADRAGRMQPNRSLLDAGATLIGGSDWPVAVTPNVWQAVAGLVTREDPSGTFPGALWPEQAITVDEAIRAYTVDAARALGLEDVAGSLAVGRSADFVELDDDPWAVRPHDIATIQPVATWFAGERVYRKATS